MEETIKSGGFDDPEYEICLCRHARRLEIENIIRSSGVSDLQSLCALANIGNVCGGCREELERLLREVRADKAPVAGA